MTAMGGGAGHARMRGAEPVPGAEAARALLIFRCGSAWFAVEAHAVDEIVEDAKATPLPLAPPHVLGLIMVRGRAVPLLALESFLALAGEEEAGSGADDAFLRVIVVNSAEMQVGIRSAKIRGVVEVTPERLVEPDALVAGRLREFSRAQFDDGGVLTAVLDLERLLGEARISG